MSEETNKAPKKRNRNKTDKKREKIPNFKSLTREEQLRVRKKAYKTYENSYFAGSKIVYSNIARYAGMNVSELMELKVKDKWDIRLAKAIARVEEQSEEEFQKVRSTLKDIRQDLTKSEINTIAKILEKAELQTERQRLFCLYYVQSFDSRWAAHRAGYDVESSHSAGISMLKNMYVEATISELKKFMHSKIFINAHDVLNEYIALSFADITQFVDFDENGVRVKPSDLVNGRLISEIRQTKDGSVVLKLHDKMRPLDKLDKLFGVTPDHRLQLERDKFEFQKKLVENPGKEMGHVTIVNNI